jgi:hypothetical protein
LAGETLVPFVESFKPFFPLKKYKTGVNQQQSTTRVIITSIAGSSVSTSSPNTQAVYVLPPGHSRYVTVYEEGYTSCSTEIDNPYSLCGNLPRICDRVIKSSGQLLLPTILSTWSLQFTIQKGSTRLTWDFPTSATNFTIRARVNLRILPSQKKQSAQPSLSKKSDSVASENGCCKGNNYRSSVHNRVCVGCPENSNSRHGGLFCESYIEEKYKKELADIKTWEEWKEWKENKGNEEQGIANKNGKRKKKGNGKRKGKKRKKNRN